MAYDPNLDNLMADANDMQRSSYASRPVIANTPRTPDETFGDPASGVIIGTPGTSPDNVGDALPSLHPLDYINNIVRPDSPSAQSYRAAQPVITASATQTRTTPITTPGSPLSSAAAEVPDARPQAVPVGYRTQTYDTGQAPLIRSNDADKLALLRASDAAARQDELAGMRQHANVANASQDLDRQRGETRVANWNADMARLDAAGNIGGPERFEAAQLASDAAKTSNQNLINAQGALAAAKTPVPITNPLDALIKVQGAAQAGQQGALANAQGQTDLQVKQQQLQQQKQLSNLGSQLAGEADPKKRQMLQDSILTLLGKEKGDRYKVIHAAGGEVLGPDGFSRIKQPDSVVIHDTQTGKVDVVPLAQQGAPAGQGKFVEGQKYVDKNGMQFIWKNGQAVPV